MCRPLRLRVAEVKSCRPAFNAETQRFRRGRGEQRQRGLLCVFSASPCLCGLPPCRNFTTRSGQKETAVARRRRVLGCLGSWSHESGPERRQVPRPRREPSQPATPPYFFPGCESALAEPGLGAFLLRPQVLVLD